MSNSLQVRPNSGASHPWYSINPAKGSCACLHTLVNTVFPLALSGCNAQWCTCSQGASRNSLCPVSANQEQDTGKLLSQRWAGWLAFGLAWKMFIYKGPGRGQVEVAYKWQAKHVEQCKAMMKLTKGKDRLTGNERKESEKEGEWKGNDTETHGSWRGKQWGNIRRHASEGVQGGWWGEVAETRTGMEAVVRRQGYRRGHLTSAGGATMEHVRSVAMVLALTPWCQTLTPCLLAFQRRRQPSDTEDHHA